MSKALDNYSFKDSTYGDNSMTLTDAEYRHVPEEAVDDTDLNLYDKFIMDKILLTEGSNNGGNLAMVKKCATDFPGKPLSAAHANLMLDT